MCHSKADSEAQLVVVLGGVLSDMQCPEFVSAHLIIKKLQSNSKLTIFFSAFFIDSQN